MKKLLIIGITMFLYGFGCNAEEINARSIAPREIELNGIHFPMSVSSFEALSKKYSQADFTIGGVKQTKWARFENIGHFDENGGYTFYFDIEDFNAMLLALRAKYPEIICNDDKSRNIENTATLETVCTLIGKSSELYISVLLSEGKLQPSLMLQPSGFIAEINGERKVELKNAERKALFDKWIPTIIMVLGFGLVSYCGYWVWKRYFGLSGLATRVAIETKKNEEKVTNAKALEAKVKAALDLAEESKKRITERINTKISQGELENAVAREFKLIDRKFDEKSLVLKAVNQKMSKGVELAVIEVKVTPVEGDYLVSVKYSPEFFSDDKVNQNEKVGFLAIQSVLFLYLYNSFGISYALIVLIASLAIRAIIKTAFPHKQKTIEIESQIERCLTNLKNEYSIIR